MTEGNSAETRLLESALILFSEKGYDGTTIREIIERAGVTRPVLYYYFENKEDLFCKLVEAEFREMTQAMDHILATVSGCRDRLRQIIAGTFQGAEEAPHVVRLILQVFFAPPEEAPKLDRHGLAKQRLERIVVTMEDGLSGGELAGGAPETLALAFAGLMDVFVMVKSSVPEARLTPELGAWLVDLFMDGAERCVSSVSNGVGSFVEALQGADPAVAQG
jgi:AcrR family transcriptional regulator